jgi:ATP-binding cassette subfamily F protein uup
LDEPTNHLDIDAIGWLEQELRSARAGFVMISHDRALLNELTRATLWIDRGQTRRQEIGFGGFEAWRDKVWEDEDQQRHKLNRKIKSEARWAVEGISARRKRNQGRVRALQDLRSERASMIRRQGAAGMVLETGQKSGKKVSEVTSISKTYDGKVILNDFSIKIQRGDRVAFVGPNGVGKTTLLKLLLGEIAPDQGTVKLGTGLMPKCGCRAGRTRFWCVANRAMLWAISKSFCLTTVRRARQYARCLAGKKPVCCWRD